MASPAAPRTAADHAFVTLITSDSYLPGALAQSAALNDLHPTRRGGPFPESTNLEKEDDPVPFTTVCLVTPETVSVGTIKELRRTFDLVIGVEVIEGDRNSEEIKLLGRPDLHQTFTKLHVLRLAQFASLVFLDADVLPLRPLSHLLNQVSSWPDEYFGDSSGDQPAAPGTASGSIPFLTASAISTRNPHRLKNPAYPCPVSAAPDSGWPDIFNSGVIVLAPPGERGFKEAMGLRSWDGGDQGTLNEWTGSQGAQSSGRPGWNRLSFKYNVTPTAAYTYAPAYAKFGSGIHAVHFIGGSKPWSGLSFRPPFISSSGRSVDKYDISAYSLTAQDSTPQSRETAYAYHVLVDRWYAVYDAHFRVVTDADGTPKSEFEVRKYESAWESGKSGPEFTAYDGGADSGLAAPDQQNQFPHVIPPHTYHVSTYSGSAAQPSQVTQPASLEELRNLALHGAGRADVARAGEGAYISLPLGGRFSLMRPPPPEPAPAPVEVHHHEEPAPAPFYEPPQHHHEHHEHHVYHEHHVHHEHHRPASPPIIAWNPAYEPPPTHLPAYSDNLPSNAWYENQWDMPHTPGYQHGHHHPQAPEQFFQAPEPERYIPKELIDGGLYSSFAGSGFQPDHTQVKSIFPWEETGNRPAPTRAFPADSRPPPAPRPQEPAKEPAPPPRPASPPRALGATYYNAWDDIPSIQRYAARLTGAKLPPPSEPAAPAAAAQPPQPQKEWSWERERGDSGDASSRDGDDEDDEDDEGQGTPKASETNVLGTNGTTKPKPKSRTSARSTRTAGGDAPTDTIGPDEADQMTSSQLKGFEQYLSEKQNTQGSPPPYEVDQSGATPAARTFDDARSVDAFKRDSHEVLSRFLKMGTWGGASTQDAPQDA